MTLEATDRYPQHHIELTKDGTTIAIDLVDANGVFDEKAIQKDQQPRLSIKMHQGGTKHSDYEPPYASTEQRDWSGGRGLDDSDLDETRFMDSFRANTWKEGKLMLAPRASYGKGYRDAESNIWSGWSSENSTIVFRSLITTSSYMSIKFTNTTEFDANVIGFILRRVGSPATISPRFSIYGDSGGEPDSEGKFTTGTMSAADINSELVFGTFPSTLTLSAATPYHAVIFDDAGTATDYWEVGCMYNVGGDGFISSNGSTWTSVNYDPYFRITDAINPFTAHFFEYRGALFAWLSYDDGSDPKLFCNGIIGKATSAAEGYITDTSKTMTANEYQYGTISLFSGAGSETADRYRVIASHDDDTFLMDTIWASSPNESTYYAVIGQDTWTEITGHGLTGPWITDVLSANNLVYTAQGDDRDIWRAYLVGMTGETWTREQGNRGHFLELAPDSYGRKKIWLGRKNWLASVDKADPVWGSGAESNLDFGQTDLITNGDMELDANWDNVGTVATNERSSTQAFDGTYSRHVVVAGDDAGIDQDVTPNVGDFYTVSARVWVVSGAVTMEMGGEEKGAVNTTGAWVFVKGSRKAASASEAVEFLSDGGAAEFYVDSVQVKEHPTYVDNVGFERITNMLSYGEPERLWVTTTGSVYMEDNGDMKSIPLKEFKSAKDERNGWAALVHDVYLYLSFLDTGVERYYKGSLDDVGPNREEGLPKTRRGYIYDMVGYPGRIYAAVHAGRKWGYSSILLYNGIGWHEVYRHPTVGEPITHMFTQPMPGTNQGSNGPAVDRLWFAVGSDLMRVDVDLNPETNSAYRYHWEGWLESSWIYYEKQDIEKYWKQLKIFLERMDGDTSDKTSVYAQYRVDGATTWTNIGLFDTEPSETISIGSNVTGKRIKFRYLLRTEDMKYSPIVQSTIVDFIEQVPTKDSYTFTFLAQDNQVTLQGRPDYDRIETDVTVLKGWLNDPDPAVCNSQISMINGKSVKILSMGFKPLIVDSKSQKEQMLYTMTVIEV